MFSALWARARYLLDHPTIVVTFIQGILAYGISQGLFALSPEQAGVVTGVVAAVLAVVTACLTTSETAIVAAVVGFLQAGAAFLVAFSFHFDTQQTAAYIGIAVTALGLIQHAKASPQYGPLADARAAVRHKILAVQPVQVVDAAKVGQDSAAEAAAEYAAKMGQLDAGEAEHSVTATGEPISIPIAASVTRPATIPDATAENVS